MNDSNTDYDYENNPAAIEKNITSNKLPQLHISSFILDKQLQGFARDFSGKWIKTGHDLVGTEVRKKLIMVVEQFTVDSNVLTSREKKVLERDKILAMNTIINFVHNSLESRIGIHNVNATFEATYAALNNAVGIQNDGRKLAKTLFGNNDDYNIPEEQSDAGGY